MKFSSSSGILEPAFNPFAEDYLAEMLDAVIVAWSRMRRPGRKEKEDHITYRLAGRIQHDPLFVDLPFDVAAQYWLLGLHGERLGRLDLRFKHKHSARDCFVFEAKRLHVTYPSGRFKPEYSGYTGADGMMCFVCGRYPTEVGVGGMLGYVMDDDCERAWDGVFAQIESCRPALKLLASSSLALSSLSGKTIKSIIGAKLGETHHDLETRRLRVLHLILPIGEPPPLKPLGSGAANS